MAKAKGLGKGLDAMLPKKIEKPKEETEKKEEENVSRETLVKISSIEPNREQPRKKFNEDALHDLADSIKQYGVLQPLLLQKKGKYYEIIAGERRWRAARLAGLKEVPAIIKEFSSQEIIEVALIENIQREDLNPIEEAQAYKKLISDFKLKQDEIAERVSKSRTAITNSMRLLKLCPEVQEMLIDDIISSGHARALIPIEDVEIQKKIANEVMDKSLSVRETETLVRKLLSDNPEKEKSKEKQKDKKTELLYKSLEDKIKSIMGTKVSIQKKSKNKGKIEIEYYSDEDLNRIYDLLMSIQK
ncbi:MAG: ParB/RepB/Spo0J family partition protein [Lachnospiraceae bacterium]|jgi:ParB family chromosome partitioning protein|nr:ParB/RepB/Spo0J family partition protein [Lachnospiraceae bacterium]